MREITFLKRNEKRWREMESLITKRKNISPDHLSDLYIGLTDDLSYAQTNYPKSKTTSYLNQLAARVHQKVYKNKKEKTKRLVYFWKIEFPTLVFKYRKQMLTAIIVFLISCLIGAYSTHVNESFVRTILGDAYVDKTIENIENGNPLGIYESMGHFEMFLRITWNNIKVSFRVFAAGILLSVFAGLMLTYNGIMLGCFQYFFYTKNLLAISVLTIWVHGTLEITSIVIAGGAGIALGNSFMFPGTHSRLRSLQRTAADTIKIIIGLVPFFIVAGFLEGFVTRYSHVSTIPALFIIMFSILFILYYFIIYPIKLHRKSYGTN